MVKRVFSLVILAITPSFSAGGFTPTNARVTTQGTSNQVTPRGPQSTTRGPVSGVPTTTRSNTQFIQGSTVSGGGISGVTTAPFNCQVLAGGGGVSRATPQQFYSQVSPGNGVAGGPTTAINAQVMQHGTGNNSGFVQRATVTARTATSFNLCHFLK